MDPNIDNLEANIFGDIRNKQFSKAINSLTLKINNSHQLIGDNRHNNGVNTRIHYLLLRGYSYFKLGSVEGLTQALEDVFSAIDLNENRFQPYLLGALILSEMKRWKNSLQMFEKSIQINDNLFETFVHKLFYLKFKILTDQGFDEELSFKCALSHRFLEDCRHKIECQTDDTDSQIRQLIVDHKKELTSDLIKDIFNDKSKPSKNDLNVGSTECWDFKPFEDFFSCGDQQLIQPLDYQNNRKTNRMPNNSLKSVAGAEEYTLSENNSLDSHFNDISHINTQNRQKLYSIKNWIETNFPADSVSKMCSFDAKHESPVTDQFMSASTADRKNSISLSDVQSIYLDDWSSVISQERHLVTNLFKLRGVYIGNLKPKCNEKALKDLFRNYGTIVDFYQPFQKNYAFIHFKTQDSALKMLTEWKGKRLDGICKDNKKLMVRFTASQEQMQKFNSMSYDEYKNRCNKAQECHLWRSGKRCGDGADCPFKHMAINRAVDTLPDKRKAKWKCN